MTAAIDTGKVTGRRELQFNCVDDIQADVERLAQCKEVRALGNWSNGQVLRHVAIVMNGSIDGAPKMMSGVMQLMIRLLFKRRFLNRPMPAGFKLPAKASMLIPSETSWEAGLNELRRALQRLKSESTRKPHPALGPLTREEWDKVHCRHSELHLSFLVPVESK
jgi:hypothetical protein